MSASNAEAADDILIGLEEHSCGPLSHCDEDPAAPTCSICTTLKTLSTRGYDFAVVPLKAETFPYLSTSPCLYKKNRRTNWNSLFIGKVDGELADPVDLVKLKSTAHFSQHHGLTALLVPPVTRGMVPQLARCINSLIHKQRMAVWYMAPWATWPVWNALRAMCGHHPLLGVCPILGMAAHTDAASFHEECDSALKRYFGFAQKSLPRNAEAQRWLAEPVRMVSLRDHCSSDSFPHDSLVPFILRNVPFLVPTDALHPFHAALKLIAERKKCFLQNTSGMNTSLLQETASKYADDALLTPLRPLQEDLENEIYETFEKDPVKYSAYTNAIERAMQRFMATHEGSAMRVAVLGAGRGPLVRCALEASVWTKCPLKVMHIVEKNTWACQALKVLIEREFKPNFPEVTFLLSQADLRSWKPDAQVDLTVSELLGSFGCNEASPECLVHGLPQILNQRGCNIPEAYSAYLSPVQSAKAHEALLKLCDKPKNQNIFEQVQIVNLRDAHFLAEAQYCFGFSHLMQTCQSDSKVDENAENALHRYCRMKFHIAHEGVLHGFAGQFHCKLFDDVVLSTVEGEQTAGLVSWYRAFFPLKTPILVKTGEHVVFHLWRRSNGAKLWYEWALEEPHCTPIANPAGAYDSVNLSMDEPFNF